MNDNFRHARYNVNWGFCFCVLYMFSRRLARLSRERFERDKSQKLTLNLFFNLMKVFHDGIIIKE